MLSRIKVAHKLLLIYALDMIAVVFLGTSLADEKYLSINFARRELVGLEYVTAARETLFAALALTDAETGRDEARRALDRQIAVLRDAEARLGNGMDTGPLVEAAVGTTQLFAQGGAVTPAVDSLRRVITRVGDMSNLILDPDLDSYYTMSLVILRFPELVDTLIRLRQAIVVRGGGGANSLAALEGRLLTVAKGFEDDLASGIRGNPDGALELALSAQYAPLFGALDRIAAALPQVGEGGDDAEARLTREIGAALTVAHQCWSASGNELERLLHKRIDGFFMRMFEHFALAGVLLAVILTAVLMVARRISRPIADLAAVADQVRIHNDYSLRARWTSRDEIGRLVVAFNTMLARLQAEGERRQELAAQARAAEAQRDLIAAITTPLVVIRLSDLVPIHANEPAAALLGPEGTGDWIARTDLERLITALGDHGQVNEFEAECTGPDGLPIWALMSARHLLFQNQEAVLIIVTPINERRRMEEELRDAKTHAERALQDLRDTQHSLIQAEKLASLGGLVAGVAHEINTPVGIGLTGASTLAVETERIHRLYRDDDMSQSDFEDYLDIANRSARLLMSNMERAASLIQSFKQVAVDQVSDERRSFDLAAYIDEILTSLHPAMRKGDVAVSVECPSGLMIDGYPGGLSQVLTNLVINAINHAFEAGQRGQVTIIVDLPDELTVRLRVRDNGKGIPQSNLGRIFDPFFTTRRSSGGSGLGLHIVYNIVTGTLKGGIEVDSEEGGGTTFTIVFPRVVESPAGPNEV